MRSQTTQRSLAALLLPGLLFLCNPACLAQNEEGNPPHLPVGRGAEGSPPLLPLDAVAERAWERLLGQTLDQHPEVRSMEEKVGEARGHYYQASLRPNPSLEVDTDTDLESVGAADRSLSVSYSHLFETASKRQRRLDVAQQEIDVAEEESAESRRLLAGELLHDFLLALAMERSLENQREIVDLSQNLVDLVQHRVQQGEAAAVELIQAQVEAGQARADLQRLQSRREGVLDELRRRAGVEPTAEPLVEGRMEPRPISTSLPELQEQALRRRPDLAAGRTEVSRVEAEVKLLEAQRTPNVLGFVRYSYSRSAFDLFGFDAAGRRAPIREADHALGVGFSIDLPFRDHREGDLAAAAAQRRSLQFRVRSLERSISREVAGARQRLDAAYSTLELLEKEVLAPSLSSLNTVRDAFQVGEIPFSEILSEQRRLYQLRQTYSELLAEYAEAAAELDRACAFSIQ